MSPVIVTNDVAQVNSRNFGPSAALDWEEFGKDIADHPVGLWKSLMLAVPAGSRHNVCNGLCRILLADTFCNIGFATWWRTGIEELGGFTPEELCRTRRSIDVLQYVLNLVEDSNND